MYVYMYKGIAELNLKSLCIKRLSMFNCVILRLANEILFWILIIETLY